MSEDIKVLSKQVEVLEAKKELEDTKGKWDIKRVEAWGALGIKIAIPALLCLGAIIVFLRIAIIFLGR